VSLARSAATVSGGRCLRAMMRLFLRIAIGVRRRADRSDSVIHASAAAGSDRALQRWLFRHLQTPQVVRERFEVAVQVCEFVSHSANGGRRSDRMATVFAERERGKGYRRAGEEGA